MDVPTAITFHFFENQRYRASGLNLVVAAITLWNTVYLERAAEVLARSRPVDQSLFQYVSPLDWEHVNLTDDYIWHTNTKERAGEKFSTLAEAVAFVESPEGRNWEK